MPWNYSSMTKKLVRKSSSVLDMGTGGGEIFSQLAPFPKQAFATEGYRPNVSLARKCLRPLGVKVIDVNKLGSKLPFQNNRFGLVLNRHDAFNAKEVFRILKPGGTFLTQQVGGGNLEALEKVFNVKPGYIDWTLVSIKKDLKRAGFTIKLARQWKGKVEFKDVGALVYFLKAIPWCIPGFSVEKNLHQLEKLQKALDRGKKLVFTEVRYIALAEKLPTRQISLYTTSLPRPSC